MIKAVELLRFLPPVRLAFVASLLLSAVAIFGTVTVARDATLYFDTAQIFLDQGLEGAFSLFDWPWFSILLAVTHSLTGLSLENCGYLWCALLLAGTCALLVDCCQRLVPGSGHLAAFVALAMPGFNQYRSDVLREFGFWFFCVLALWLVGRWRERGGWSGACLIQLAILMAAAFRLEAVFLVAALAAWSLTERPWSRILQLNMLPVLAALLALFILSFSGISLARLSYYLELLNPTHLLTSFSALAQHLADGMRHKYSRDDAELIVFLGMLGTLIVGAAASMGPLSLPLLCTGRQAWRFLITSAGSYFSWAWLGYFVVLLVFFVHNQFMISRYESLLAVLVVPAAVIALRDFLVRFPRSGRVLLAVVLLVMLDNVISLGAKKTQLVDAGQWMASNVPVGDPVYYDDVRISYYAGRGALRQPHPRDIAMSAEHAGNYRYFFVEVRADVPWLQEWLRQHQKRILTSFSNAKGETVLVLGD